MSDQMTVIATDHDTRNLEHFLELARTGRCRGSSFSEKGCRDLADLVLKHVPGLDNSARAGLIDFINFAADHPTTARDLLR